MSPKYILQFQNRSFKPAEHFKDRLMNKQIFVYFFLLLLYLISDLNKFRFFFVENVKKFLMFIKLLQLFVLLI